MNAYTPKTLIPALAVALASLAPMSAYASGFPTVDAAALGQRLQDYQQKLQDYIKQNEQLVAMKKQYDEAKKILETGKEQVAAIKGVYNQGMAAYNGVKSVIDSVPRNMDEITSSALGGSFGKEAAELAKELQSLDKGRFSDLQMGKTYDRSVKATQAAILTTNRAIENLNKNIANLEGFAKKIDQAETLKESQDLQNAIHIEMGAANANLIMLEAANLKVQAEINNEMNQATQADQLHIEAIAAAYEKEYGTSSTPATVTVSTESQR